MFAGLQYNCFLILECLSHSVTYYTNNTSLVSGFKKSNIIKLKFPTHVDKWKLACASININQYNKRAESRTKEESLDTKYDLKE